MYVFYEDDGQFKIGKTISTADTTLQIDTTSGKRSKIKRTQVVFEFNTPDPDTLLKESDRLVQEMDIAFLWEFAPTEEFTIQAFANDYFGHTPNSVELAALTSKIHAAPVYFHRKGKGKYLAAPPQILEAALAAIEKKQKQAEQQQSWAQSMIAGELPPEVADSAKHFLIKPDKNSLQWKAFQQACDESSQSPERLLLKLGVYTSAYHMHRAKFFSEYFPKGRQAPDIDVPAIQKDLPLSTVTAYSIDDQHTTEIDDALSVTQLGDAKLQIGIHIAAPALVVSRDSMLDKMARERMSTVYLPGEKTPMQGHALIERFSLDEHQERPCISLYLTVDAHTGEIYSHESKIEKIIITKNLRLHELENQLTEERLEDPHDMELPYASFFRPLWHVSKALNKQRELVRGKPENNDRAEFSFHIIGDHHDPETAIIEITPRKRNAPIDRMVGEYMILANSVWAGMLSDTGVPGIFRSQHMGRVRVSTHPAPHDSIGVSQYGWHTSPLRRYIDLINQGQLISVIESGVSARLVAPFKPKEADLYAIIEAFDAKHQAYSDFQRTIENFWCLTWLKQHEVKRINAVVIKEDLVRLEGLPYYTRVCGLPELERDEQVSLEIIGMDTIDMTLETRYITFSQEPSSESSTDVIN